jgi:hypothetical protein
MCLFVEQKRLAASLKSEGSRPYNFHVTSSGLGAFLQKVHTHDFCVTNLSSKQARDQFDSFLLQTIETIPIAIN